jgi:hypothetical protein
VVVIAIKDNSFKSSDEEIAFVNKECRKPELEKGGEM